MSKNKRKFIFSTIFILVLGILFHFIYDFFNQSSIVGVIGAVNESAWEHLKLLFWPFLFVRLGAYFINKSHSNNFFTVTLISILVGMLLIVSLFYTYSGIIGKNNLVVDIIIFVIAVAVSNYLYFKMIKSSLHNDKINIISLITLIGLMLIFVFFTFDPPKIPLFKDPLTSQYGIK